MYKYKASILYKTTQCALSRVSHFLCPSQHWVRVGLRLKTCCVGCVSIMGHVKVMQHRLLYERLPPHLLAISRSLLRTFHPKYQLGSFVRSIKQQVALGLFHQGVKCTGPLV